jgi:hypothetical protein
VARLQIGVGDAADVPELQIDAPALVVRRLGGEAPAGDLLGRPDAWRADVALALGADVGGFRDDEAGGGALSVVGRLQLAGTPASSARERVSGAMTMRFERVVGPSWTGSKRSVVMAAWARDPSGMARAPGEGQVGTACKLADVPIERASGHLRGITAADKPARRFVIALLLRGNHCSFVAKLSGARFQKRHGRVARSQSASSCQESRRQ